MTRPYLLRLAAGLALLPAGRLHVPCPASTEPDRAVRRRPALPRRLPRRPRPRNRRAPARRGRRSAGSRARRDPRPALPLRHPAAHRRQPGERGAGTRRQRRAGDGLRRGRPRRLRPAPGRDAAPGGTRRAGWFRRAGGALQPSVAAASRPRRKPAAPGDRPRDRGGGAGVPLAAGATTVEQALRQAWPRNS